MKKGQYIKFEYHRLTDSDKLNNPRMLCVSIPKEYTKHITRGRYEITIMNIGEIQPKIREFKFCESEKQKRR